MRRSFVGITAATLLLAAAGAAVADQAGPAASANRIDLALIGDTPYGAEQLAAFPALVSAINSDPKVRLVAHVGDIKNGSTRCDDSYFALVAQQFSTFKDPLVYTPGDNEWADCHRLNNGAYNPLERLAKLRATFFAEPGEALGGRNLLVEAQDAFPENQLWAQSRVVFAAVHAVGSDNGYAPWTSNTAATPAQRAEVDARINAALAWINRVFDLAAEQNAAGVALLMQADTFAGANETLDGFDEIVAAIGTRAAQFGKPVLLLQGDTHRYLVDEPYATAPNLTRVVVEGETAAEWLRVSVNPRSPAVFSWEREILPAG